MSPYYAFTFIVPCCQISEFQQCPITMHALQQSDLKQSVLVTEVAQLTELKTVDRLLNIVIRNSLKLNRTTNANDSTIQGRSMF